jgi:hypothetical protein
MKLLIVFSTYPRDGKSTYGLLKKTVDSMAIPASTEDLTIQILVVGDDYPNMEELRPLFADHACEFVNINVGCALRNTGAPREVKWAQAVTRSVLYAFETALTRYSDYDYIMLSADDELYMNDKIGTTIRYIRDYNKPDFVFSRGVYCGGGHLPHHYDSVNLLANVPRNSNTIASGVCFKLANRAFIEDIIAFKKGRWSSVEHGLQTGNFGGVYAEDAELWDYLGPHFHAGKYTSLLIPHLLIHHYTEKTLYTYIS